LLTKNKTLTCRVEAFGAGGEGICRPEGQVMFVPFALPGELVSVRVEKAMKTHAFGKLLNVLEPSPMRTDPPCPYYYRCGGCSSQHMRYEEQKRLKRQTVVDCMSRIGGLGSLQTAETSGMEEPWRYRNKTALPVAMVNGEAAAGYYAPRSHRLIPVASCLIADETSDIAAAAILRWMKEFSVIPYQEADNSGLIRHIITRKNDRSESMVTLAVNGPTIPHRDELISALRESLPRLASVCITTQESGGNMILGGSYRTLWGSPTLTDRISGLEFELSPLSFFQVNREICEKMYACALREVELVKYDCLIDLYSGIGTISLLAARSCGRVIGIELSPAAVADGKQNAKHNGIGNVEFMQGTAEDILPELVKSGIQADVVILDPPRKGAHQAVLKAIAQIKPRRIVYISCHPASQARDAAVLSGLGYQAVRAQPFDMFCQTAQVENILTFLQMPGG
jgi:23S rRNA (uracil1939-C5)-methyltransferase